MLIIAPIDCSQASEASVSVRIPAPRHLLTPTSRIRSCDGSSPVSPSQSIPPNSPPMSPCAPWTPTSIGPSPPPTPTAGVPDTSEINISPFPKYIASITPTGNHHRDVQRPCGHTVHPASAAHYTHHRCPSCFISDHITLLRKCHNRICDLDGVHSYSGLLDLKQSSDPAERQWLRNYQDVVSGNGKEGIKSRNRKRKRNDYSFTEDLGYRAIKVTLINALENFNSLAELEKAWDLKQEEESMNIDEEEEEENVWGDSDTVADDATWDTSAKWALNLWKHAEEQLGYLPGDSVKDGFEATACIDAAAHRKDMFKEYPLPKFREMKEEEEEYPLQPPKKKSCLRSVSKTKKDSRIKFNQTVEVCEKIDVDKIRWAAPAPKRKRKEKSKKPQSWWNKIAKYFPWRKTTPLPPLVYDIPPSTRPINDLPLKDEAMEEEEEGEEEVRVIRGSPDWEGNWLSPPEHTRMNTSGCKFHDCTKMSLEEWEDLVREYQRTGQNLDILGQEEPPLLGAYLSVSAAFALTAGISFGLTGYGIYDPAVQIFR